MDSKIPNIRFKGFTDAWEQRRLGEVTIYQNGKGYEDSQSSSGKFELINLNSISIDGGLKSSGKYIESADKTLLTDDLVMVLSDVGKGDLLGRVAIIPKDNYYVLNQRVALIRPKNKQQTNYLFSYINSHQRYFKLHGAGMSQLNISKGSVENFPLLLPSLPEQQQIGTFFAHLDTLISLHQRKCDQTKELKKTMLQKMFPKKGERIPEIRFPEFTDEWEEKKLGEMLTERNVQQVPKEDAPLVSFTVENGVTPKTDRYDREFLVRTGDKKYKYTTFDDIVYNPANLKFGAIARNKFGDAVFSPIYVTLVADKEKVLPIFIERIVTNGNFIQESLRYQEGTVYERMSVKVPDFLSMKISIPSLPEQEAIGTYFQTLDQDIAQIEKKLADLKELKKALLRQLFV